MADYHSELSAAIGEADQALKRLARITAVQIRNSEHRDYLRAIAYSWFRSRRPTITQHVAAEQLDAVDTQFRIILDASERSAAKNTFVAALKAAKDALMKARTGALSGAPLVSSADTVPDFSPLASDPAMQAILSRRWQECRRCIDAHAPLAATVMMGGLLEALFVARANKLGDKSHLFKCAGTPIDGRTKKPLDLKSWTLAPYIDVGHELKWISSTARDVASVLRDYRNYIHPEKERSHGVTISPADTEIFWELTKSLARQLLSLQGAQ